jgi:hypothetical protein
MRNLRARAVRDRALFLWHGRVKTTPAEDRLAGRSLGRAKARPYIGRTRPDGYIWRDA